MRTSLLEIHAAVVLFGLAGLFGKLLLLPAPIIVLGRAFFGAAALLLILLLTNARSPLRSKHDFLGLSALGVILALHWVTFFKSIQVSTVAVGLISYSTFPAFTVVAEPCLLGGRVRPLDVFLALLALFGVVLIVPGFEMHADLTRGVVWGTASGALFAILSVLNRHYVRLYSSLLIAFHQNAVAALVLLPALFVLDFRLRPFDVALLLALGILLTAIAHTLFIRGMRNVSARVASIIACLEPAYGIVVAVLVLGEIPAARTLIGGAVILMTAFYASSRAGNTSGGI